MRTQKYVTRQTLQQSKRTRIIFNYRWILLVIDQRVSGSSGAANEHNGVDLAALARLHGPTDASFCMPRLQMGHHRYITELDCVAVAQNPIRFDWLEWKAIAKSKVAFAAWPEELRISLTGPQPSSSH